MRYIENGVPEDFAKLCFAGMTVPLCELSEEEYMEVVFGIKGYKGKGKRGTGTLFLPVEEQENKLLKEPIGILELSIRPQHGLQRAGIETIGQLVAMTEWQVAKIRNMGAKSVKEVTDALAKLNLSLKAADEE